jgi:hypothetical protein
LPQPGKGPFLNGGKEDESGLYHENAEQSRWFIYLSNSKFSGKSQIIMAPSRIRQQPNALKDEVRALF